MLFKANSFLKTWCLCTEHCGLLDLLGLGWVRLAAGLAVVPAKAVLVRHVDVPMGTSPGSTMPETGREEENLGCLQATKLQLCFRWCSQRWSEMGEVVRGLPRH